MSEVAADTPDKRRRRQQKLTAMIPAKPWGGIWARARFMARGNITWDPAVADDVERGVKSWIVHIDCLRVASPLPDLLSSSG